jgi:alkylation response protein AidB-like acyl-CoA dehydrogenase
MEFGFTEAQQRLYAEMKALGEAAQALPADLRMQRLAEGGALGLALAPEHGGRGLDLVSTAHAFEALGASLDDGGLLLAAGAHLFGVALTLERAGGPELCAAWLSRLARGEVLATIGATEQGAGSDVSRVETALEEGPEGLVVTGHKRFVTYADRAGLVLVLAREPEGDAITTCLVERPDPGVSVERPHATAGLAGARLAALTLTRAKVVGVVGRRGAGRSVFQLAMTFERALILAFRVGAMRRPSTSRSRSRARARWGARRSRGTRPWPTAWRA